MAISNVLSIYRYFRYVLSVLRNKYCAKLAISGQCFSNIMCAFMYQIRHT